jgi:hypothetical protein
MPENASGTPRKPRRRAPGTPPSPEAQATGRLRSLAAKIQRELQLTDEQVATVLGDVRGTFARRAGRARLAAEDTKAGPS